MLRIVFYFLILLNFEVYAQEDSCAYTFIGRVQIEEGNFDQSISIALKNSNKVTYIDTLGLFSFSSLCSKQYILQFKQFGFVIEEQSFLLLGDTSIVFEMNQKSNNLPGVKIVGSQNRDRTAFQEDLTADQIDKSKGLSLGGMLADINGVRVLKTGSSIAKPVIHGLHSNRILVLNNGIRQEGQQWGAEHAPEIDPFISNSISVIKGANSIKYGFDAIGGVILVRPKKISDSVGFSGALNLVGFTNGRQGNVSGNISNRFKNLPSLSFAIQGSVKRGGNLHTPTYYLKNTGVKEYNFSAGLNWEKAKYGVQLFYSQFNTQLGIFSGSHIGNLTDLENAFDRTQPIDSAGFSYFIDRPQQQIEHELSKVQFYLKTGDIGELNIAYGRQYNLRFEYDKHKSLNASIASLNNPDLQLELTTHTIDLSWKQYTINGFKGEIGINSIQQKNTYSGRMFIPNYANQGIGGYIVESKKYKKILFEAGARFDVRLLQSFYWEDDVIVSPKNDFSDWAANFGAKYTIKPRNTIALNFSKTWRPPSVNELYSDGLHHGAAAVEIGDASLSKESAYNANLDMELSSKKLRISVNPYFNYFENFVYLEPQLPPTLTIKGAFPTFVFKEAKAYIYGVDAQLNYELFKRVDYVLKVAVVRGYNATISDYLIQMPADHIQNTIEFQLKDFKLLQNNEISFRYSYTALQIRVPANSDFAAPPASYHLFDCMYSTVIETKHIPITLSVGINNLFNISYRDYLNRFRYYSDEIGRNFSIRLKIPLNNKT